MIPSEYTLRGIHLVNLADRYATSGYLLGKSITVRYSDHILINIVFPSILDKVAFPVLGIIGLMEKYGIDEDDWGTIKSYVDINMPETVEAWISKVLVECYTDDISLRLNACEIEAISNKLIHAIQTINPDSIRIDRDERKNEICEVKTSIDINTDGKAQVGFVFRSVIDDRKGNLSFSDIKEGIMNIHKVISAPYEMLDNARRNLDYHDTRASVLNCATAIELTLKRMVLGFLDSAETQESIKNYVMKQADGFSRLVELCKKFRLPIEVMPNVKESVFSIRDIVIHRGYVPSYKEAHKAYESSRATLKALNVPMFE